MSTRNKRSIGIASQAAALACGALLAVAATPAAAVVHTFTNVNKSVTYSFQNNVMELQSFDVAGFAVQFGFSGNAGQAENPVILGNNQLGLLKVPFSSTLQNLAAGATIAPVQNLYTQVTAGLFEGPSN